MAVYGAWRAWLEAMESRPGEPVELLANHQPRLSGATRAALARRGAGAVVEKQGTRWRVVLYPLLDGQPSGHLMEERLAERGPFQAWTRSNPHGWLSPRELDRLASAGCFVATWSQGSGLWGIRVGWMAGAGPRQEESMEAMRDRKQAEGAYWNERRAAWAR